MRKIPFLLETTSILWIKIHFLLELLQNCNDFSSFIYDKIKTKKGR